MTDPALVERLAEAVHNGWKKVRIAQGYANHPYHAARIGSLTVCTACRISIDQSQSTENTHHDNMVPYADLPETGKEASRESARAVLAELTSEPAGDNHGGLLWHAERIAQGLDEVERYYSDVLNRTYTKDDAQVAIDKEQIAEGIYTIRLSHELAVIWAKRLRGEEIEAP